MFSCQGQRLEIRFVPAPREDQAQGQAPAQRVEKTLRELNDMDPYAYDFAVRNIALGVLLGFASVSVLFPVYSLFYHKI
jgi:hypothetical protein